MASTSQNLSVETSEHTVEFNYWTVKHNFYSELDRICPKTVSLTNLSWGSVIQFVIKAILDGKNKQNRGCKIDRFAECAMATYDVITVDEKSVLILKQEGHGQPIVVISNEECFDLLRTIHLENNHADLDTMKSLIAGKYLISEQNLNLFLVLCNVCNKPRQFVRHSYYVFIINLVTSTDDPYKYLLTLVETSTNFYILRPLVISNRTEISLELFKIFSDYGPPASLLTPVLENNCFFGVNSKISQMCPEFDFKIENIASDEIAKFENEVKSKLYFWAAMTESMNWATGCRMIQWRLNNIENHHKTPFKSLFGEQPNDSLHPNPVWLRFRDENQSEIDDKIANLKKKFNIEENDESSWSGASAIKECSITTRFNYEVSTEGHILSRCIICKNLVYSVSVCSSCNCVMHSFCGKRFVGNKRKMIHLCMHCKDKPKFRGKN